MLAAGRPARLNVKLLVTLVAVVLALSGGAVAARTVRSRILAARALSEGQAAFERADWSEACKQLQRYLSRSPDDVAVLGQYARALLSLRPMDAKNVAGAIAAYRRVLRLRPGDETACAKLADLYWATRNHAELTYIARARLAAAGDDPRARLWLAKAAILQHRSGQARQMLTELVGSLEGDRESRAELVAACYWLSSLAAEGPAGPLSETVFGWLDRAVAADAGSAEALVRRARFYRQRAGVAGDEQAAAADVAAARADLEAAERLVAASPLVSLMLGGEWLELGQYDRAAAQLEFAKSLTPAQVRAGVLDVDDWEKGKFLQEAEILLRTGAATQGAALADRALSPADPQSASLRYRRQRVQALPAGVRLYVAAGRVQDARRCLEEYLELVLLLQPASEPPAKIALLRAFVARAADEPYRVLEYLEPFTSANSPNDQRELMWSMIAEACRLTGQTRRETRALAQYVRLRPGDSAAALRLVRAYIRQRDWPRALEVARMSEAAQPADIDLRLLRIEAGLLVATGAAKPIAAEQTGKMEAELDALRRAHPGKVEVRQMQAALALYRGDAERAERELRSAIEECQETLPAELQLARLYLLRGRNDEARAVCRAATERHPQRAAAWEALADVLARAGQLAQAQAAIAAGLAAANERRAQRTLGVTLARLELLQGRRSAAIERLERLAAQNPQDVGVRTLLLELPEVRQDPQRAQALVDELHAIEGDGGPIWRLHQAALWLADAGWRSRQQQIIEALTRCWETDPQWTAPALLLGRTYERLNNLERAESTYRRALTLRPNSIEIADRLLNLLERQQRYSEAGEILKRLELSPRALSARRVAVALRSGDLAEARRELELRVASDPNDADARVLLARLVYRDQRDWRRAFEYLDQAEQLAGVSRASVVARVWILNSEGRPTEAERLLTTLVARDGTFAAYLLRAAFYAGTQRLQQAEQDYAKLVELADDAGGYVALGQFFFDTGRPDQALATWQRGLQDYPEDAALQRRLMKGLLWRGRPGDRRRAEESLSTLSARYPDDPDLMAVRAGLLLEKGTEADRRSAQRLLERVVQLQPGHLQGYLWLIRLAYERGDFVAVRGLAVQALAANPDSPELLLARAEAERALGNVSTARRLALLVLEDHPDHPGARNLLVALALRSREAGQLAEALGVVTGQLEAAPDDSGLQQGRARLLDALGRTGQAIEHLEEFVRRCADDCDAGTQLELAGLYWSSGDLAAAGRWFRRAFENASVDARLVQERIAWLADQQRADEIAALVEIYVQACPGEPVVPTAAAEALANAGSNNYVRTARELLRHACRVAPTSTVACLGYARLAYVTGEVEQAVKTYREVLAREPANTQALNNLAWVLYETATSREHYLAALELAERGVELAPEDPHLRDTRGSILTKLPGRGAAALADFQKCLSLSPPESPQRAKALLQLARVSAALGDPAAANRYLDEAQRIDGRRGVFTSAERTEIERLRNAPPPEE